MSTTNTTTTCHPPSPLHRTLLTWAPPLILTLFPLLILSTYLLLHLTALSPPPANDNEKPSSAERISAWHNFKLRLRDPRPARAGTWPLATFLYCLILSMLISVLDMTLNMSYGLAGAKWSRESTCGVLPCVVFCILGVAAVCVAVVSIVVVLAFVSLCWLHVTDRVIGLKDGKRERGGRRDGSREKKGKEVVELRGGVKGKS